MPTPDWITYKLGRTAVVYKPEHAPPRIITRCNSTQCVFHDLSCLPMVHCTATVGGHLRIGFSDTYWENPKGSEYEGWAVPDQCPLEDTDEFKAEQSARSAGL